MLDLIILFFLCRNIRKLALEKNLNPVKWVILTVIGWFLGEAIGVNISLSWNGIAAVNNFEELSKIILNTPDIVFFGLFCGFGGYLIVRKVLEKKPDAEI